MSEINLDKIEIKQLKTKLKLMKLAFECWSENDITDDLYERLTKTIIEDLQ